MIRKVRFNSLIDVNWEISDISLHPWGTSQPSADPPRQHSQHNPGRPWRFLLKNKEMFTMSWGLPLGSWHVPLTGNPARQVAAVSSEERENVTSGWGGSQKPPGLTEFNLYHKSSTQSYFRADQHQEYNHIIWSSSGSMCLLKSCYWFNELLQLFSITRN